MFLHEKKVLYKKLPNYIPCTLRDVITGYCFIMIWGKNTISVTYCVYVFGHFVCGVIVCDIFFI